MIELIPDKYYCIQFQSIVLGAEKLYFKIDYYLDKRKIYYLKYHISLSNYIYVEGGGIYDSDIKNYLIEEVDLSEIVKYLPIGHPDRNLFRKERINKLLNL